MPLRFAVLGAGRIGQVHANALAAVPDARLTAIAEPQAEVARRTADAHGCEVRDIDRIAAAGDIDAVIICTPTDTHADLIERFCRAGKAVFCEKPMDLSLARVRQTLAVVAATGGLLMMGFQRRFDPDFMALHAAIQAGRIGAVEMITLTSRDPAPPSYEYLRHAGGIFRDMTIHDFDMARWLLGEAVQTVQASAAVLVDPEIGKLGDYDSANVLLSTASGRQCVITNSRRAAYGYDQRIEVLGAQGCIRAHNTHEANIDVADGAGYSRPPLLNFFMSRYTAAYANEIAAFAAAIRNGTPPPTSGDDGLQALALADAALLAVTEQRVVRLSEILD